MINLCYTANAIAGQTTTSVHFVECSQQHSCNTPMHRACNPNTKHVNKHNHVTMRWFLRNDPATYRFSPDWQSCSSTSTAACVEGGTCEHSGWIQTAYFGVHWNVSKPCVTLEPIMRNTHKLYILCLVSWVSLRKQKRWKLKNRMGEMWAMNPA